MIGRSSRSFLVLPESTRYNDYVAIMRITKKAVDTAPIPVGGDVYFWDTEPRGFGLRVTPNGIRSYVVQYRLSGRPARRTTIGVHGSPWTPETARSEALRLLTIVRSGVDPVEARKKAVRLATDFEVAAYVGNFVTGYLQTEWPDTWRTAKRQLETYFVQPLKGRSLMMIERHDVTAILDGLRGMPAAARNVHAVIRKLFRWAVNRGDLAVSPIAEMEAPAAVKARKRVLSPDELIAVWQASAFLPTPYGPWVRLLMITLQRRNEVAGLGWPELSHNGRLWALPGDRAKNGRDHIVPLSALALAELDELKWKTRGLLFPSSRETPISGFAKIKSKLDAAVLPLLQGMADERADALGEDREAVTLPRWVLHDLRRTGTTAMQSLGVPIEVTERCINHISGETAGIRGVYNLHSYATEKRDAMEAWSAYLQKLIVGSHGLSTVTPMTVQAA